MAKSPRDFKQALGRLIYFSEFPENIKKKFSYDLSVSRIYNKWNLIIGDRLCQFTRPSSIYKNVLFVDCNHQGWVQTLQFHKKNILANIYLYFDDLKKIKDIRFRYYDFEPRKKYKKDNKKNFKSDIKYSTTNNLEEVLECFKVMYENSKNYSEKSNNKYK